MGRLRWCAIPLLLCAPGSWAAEPDMYGRMAELITDRYLEIEDFDGRRAFLEAAEAAEDAVPWLIARGDPARPDTVILDHGMFGQFAVVHYAEGGAAADLPQALLELEAEIMSAGPIPEDVDLGVELMRGAARELDRHSVVLARDRLARFDERIQGRLSGIGARVGRTGEELVVKEIFVDSPALAGGLSVGDRITRIDGRSTVGMSVDQAVGLIRGPEGSILTLSLLRAGVEEEFEQSFERAEVAIQNVHWSRLSGGAGLISIDNFSEQTSRLVNSALEELLAGPYPAMGIVLDLRGNTGGSMTQACLLVDSFLDEGLVLRTAGRGGEPVKKLLPEYRAYTDERDVALPLVVLVDHRSASASEIAAGALVRAERAVLLGERSYGKGTVQKVYTLRSGEEEDRVRLKLTVARFLVGGDQPIEAGVGLAPDLLVEPVIFSDAGVSLPAPPPPGQPTVRLAEERPGWRSGVELAPAGDPLVELAEAVLERTEGAHRMDMLAAVEEVSAARQREEDARLVEAFSWRGLDWRPADEEGPPPEVSVRVEVMEPPRAGNLVELRATVHNQGKAPLYQARVHLTADSPGLPWDGLSLPIGFLPPGEEAMGSVLLRLPIDAGTREDEVGIRLEADGRPIIQLDPSILSLEGRDPPPLVATARLVPMGDHHRVEVELENQGRELLTGLDAVLAWPEGGEVELIDRDARLATLAPGEKHRLDLELRVLGPTLPATLPLQLKVDADKLGQVLRLPMLLPTNGDALHLAPPELRGELPIRAPAGKLTAQIFAEDPDGSLASLTVWVGRDKVLWRELHEPKLEIQVPIEVGEKTLSVTAKVEDEAGISTWHTWYVHGLGDPPAADGGE